MNSVLTPGMILRDDYGYVQIEIAREAEHMWDGKQCETCEKRYIEEKLACNNVLLFKGKFYETKCSNYDKLSDKTRLAVQIESNKSLTKLVAEGKIHYSF